MTTPPAFTNGLFRQLGPNGIFSGSFTLASSVNTAATPEPTPLVLLATGLLALPFALRRNLA